MTTPLKVMLTKWIPFSLILDAECIFADVQKCFTSYCNGVYIAYFWELTAAKLRGILVENLKISINFWTLSFNSIVPEYFAV